MVGFSARAAAGVEEPLNAARAPHARDPVNMTVAAASEWPSHGVLNSIPLNKPFAPSQVVTAISQLSLPDRHFPSLISNGLLRGAES
jgi:hypothetical protein